MKIRPLAVALLLCTGLPTLADEGMWPLDDFPSAKVQEKYGFSPDPAWLEHVRLSSVRLAGGCSGSFVSADGLVMTNHHCSHSCIEQLSTAKKDYVAEGFYAKKGSDEVKCPEIEINQLIEITEVTARMDAATKDLTDEKYAAAQRAEMTRIENEACKDRDDLRCEVVPLYHGGHYDLYKYRRFQDVRLVFAPEFDIAFFGGDPDNFMFPRYDLDVSFLRVYENGKPAKVDHYFKWSTAGPKDGEPTFVSGHPGSTDRLLTLAQLEYARDVEMPDAMLYQAELRGLLTEFQRRGPEQKRVSTSELFYLENGLKARNGGLVALHDKSVFAGKAAAEKALRDKVEADPKLKEAYGGAWDAIEQAVELEKNVRVPLTYIESRRGFRSDLFGYARTLVRAADELPKANETRLREFTDARLPGIRQRLASTAPVYNDLEILTLTYSLTKMREALSADDPFVKKVLGDKSPEDLATEAVKGSKLADPKVRLALFEGGKKAVDASDDPMIRLAKLVDPDARALRKQYEDTIEAVIDKSSEKVARAQFAVYGTSIYPDATFTLRLSYGQVKGYADNGKQVKPFTTLGGAFDRATGRDPFRLPKSWIDAKKKLDLNVPFNFVSDNDIIGGNSGSPVIDKDARVVGLIFDGNIQSLAGDYWFDPAVNRAVAVDTAALTEALDKIYDAKRIVEELKKAGSR